MIPLRKLERYAKMKEEENYEFRTWLKIHADPGDLDERFSRLHNELFAEYDCTRCRNCCKKYKAGIPLEDVESDAQFLGMDTTEFRNRFLQKDLNGEGAYLTMHAPCDFLQEDGNCLLGDHQPQSCKLYPYTDQPDRLGSMYSFLDTITICPVAYEICERLKKEYRFRG